MVVKPQCRATAADLQDRFLPAELQRQVVGERLGITPDEMDGGHCRAELSRPQELADRLEAYKADV